MYEILHEFRKVENTTIASEIVKEIENLNDITADLLEIFNDKYVDLLKEPKYYENSNSIEEDFLNIFLKDIVIRNIETGEEFRIREKIKN